MAKLLSVRTHIKNPCSYYACRIADHVEQAKQLVESGFDYVTEVDGHKLFRKRK